MATAEPGREDLTKVYEAGRSAFNRGGYAKAKVAFARVLKAKPDFDLALIYMAQIRTAEAKWEARPRSRKISETATVANVALTKVSLADALELLRREVEKAGGGASAGPIELLTDLPVPVLERPVELAVKQVPMADFANMIAFTGGVGIAWHPRGISVTANQPAAPDDEARAATAKATQQAARALILPHLKMEGASLPEALAWLNRQTATSRGPILLAREPLSQATITLDLRQIPLTEALNSIALVTGMEVSWHPWGAGLTNSSEIAATTSGPTTGK